MATLTRAGSAIPTKDRGQSVSGQAGSGFRDTPLITGEHKLRERRAIALDSSLDLAPDAFRRWANFASGGFCFPNAVCSAPRPRSSYDITVSMGTPRVSSVSS